MGHAEYRHNRSQLNWLFGLVLLILLVTGGLRFIVPIMLVVGFFFFLLPRLLNKAQAWGDCGSRRHGPHRHSEWRGWGGSSWERHYQEEKRKRGFDQAEDAAYAEKPKRDAYDRAEYVIGPDGELEPVRHARRDDYV